MSTKRESSVDVVKTNEGIMVSPLSNSLASPIICTTQFVPKWVVFYHELATAGDADGYSARKRVVTFYPQEFDFTKFADDGLTEDTVKVYLVYRERDKNVSPL